jgi:hypothetical protein
MQAGRFAKNIVVANPGRISAKAAAFAKTWVAPAIKACFRPTIEGIENLPKDRPFLLVTNHSAGVGIAEILSLAVLWLEKFGTDRPLAGFALPLGFVVWPLSAIHREIGTIPSSYPAAYDTLAKGVPLLVFPGGDHESLKPIWQVDRVDFANRVGFLRIAREAGVPIVPMGIRNGAWTAPILWRSEVMSWLLVVPRLLGVKRWGVSLLGAIGVVVIASLDSVPWPWRAVAAWAWMGSPFTFLPIFPATLRYRVGEPLECAELFDSSASDANLRAALARVQAAVQRLVDR